MRPQFCSRIEFSSSPPPFHTAPPPPTTHPDRPLEESLLPLYVATVCLVGVPLRTLQQVHPYVNQCFKIATGLVYVRCPNGCSIAQDRCSITAAPSVLCIAGGGGTSHREPMRTYILDQLTTLAGHRSSADAHLITLLPPPTSWTSFKKSGDICTHPWDTL